MGLPEMRATWVQGLGRRCVGIAARRATQTRGGGPAKPTYGTPYNGFEPPIDRGIHKVGAEIIGTFMWFWIFYRMKEDGATIFLGDHPFLHHGSDDHGDNH